jgi:ATP-dependent Clp protease ATP-binding subunit ClpC
VRRRPYSVVLFDEAEKAHPDVMHMLLQILEEGKLTDSFGRHVDFRNTVIILTSNLGHDAAKRGAGLGFAGSGESASHEKMKALMVEEAKRTFKPELLNRFDDLVVFRQLTRDDVSKILDLELAKVRARVAAKGKQLRLSRSARSFLIEHGFDPALGARPLRRAIERYVEDPLSEEMLRGRLGEGKVIEVLHAGDGMQFRAKSGAREKEVAKK